MSYQRGDSNSPSSRKKFQPLPLHVSSTDRAYGTSRGGAATPTGIPRPSTSQASPSPAALAASLQLQQQQQQARPGTTLPGVRTKFERIRGIDQAGPAAASPSTTKPIPNSQEQQQWVQQQLQLHQQQRLLQHPQLPQGGPSAGSPSASASGAAAPLSAPSDGSDAVAPEGRSGLGRAASRIVRGVQNGPDLSAAADALHILAASNAPLPAVNPVELITHDLSKLAPHAGSPSTSGPLSASPARSTGAGLPPQSPLSRASGVPPAAAGSALQPVRSSSDAAGRNPGGGPLAASPGPARSVSVPSGGGGAGSPLPLSAVPSMNQMFARGSSGAASMGAWSSASSKRPVTESKGMFLDLLEATRKSFAAGMGDWDLQALEWGHPEFKRRLLQSTLGPENLKNAHGLMEPDILRLYRVLYLYSVGFCAAVLEPTERARAREQLLENVFKTYAQLWDEALAISFQSEIVDALRNKTDAVAAMRLMEGELAAVRAESAELQDRLTAFVRGNIDNMLAYRMLKDRSSNAEGEVMMLTHASDQLSIKLAGLEVKSEGLERSAENAEQRATAAESRASEFERQAARLKAALSEQQSVTMRQARQVKELEVAVVKAMGETAAAKMQTSEARAAMASAGGKEAELQRQIADKSLAYTLLHADYVVKMHDLDELRVVTAEQQAKIEEMRSTYESATAQISEAKGQEDVWRRKWEAGRMYMEDLETSNTRLIAKNRELVASYWPVMSRLRDVEAENRQLIAEAERVKGDNAALVEEAKQLRAEVEAKAQLAAKLARMEQEMSIEDVQLPESALSSIDPDTSRARAFVRASRRKVSELTQQLVRLVDVQASSAYDLQQSQAANSALRGKIAFLEGQMKELQDEVTRLMARASLQRNRSLAVRPQQAGDLPPRPPGEGAGAAAAPGEAAEALEGLQRDVQEARARAESSNAKRAVVEDELVQLRLQIERLQREVEARDALVREAATMARRKAAECDELLLKDPDAPRPVSFGSAEEQRPAAAAAGTDAASDGSPAVEAADEAAGADADAAAAGTDGQAQQPQAAAAARQRYVATGPLVQGAGVPAETRPPLVELDAGWEALGEALDRLMDWGGSIMALKPDLHALAALKEELATVSATASGALSELAATREQLSTSQARVKELERQAADSARTVASCVRTAAEAEATRGALESGLQSTREALTEVTEKHTLMEEEYWAIKAKLLEAELSRGEIVAARDRAVADHAKLLEQVKKLEAETADHRAQRRQLEADLVGCKAWIRTMEGTEKRYRALLTEVGQLTDGNSDKEARAREWEEKASSLEAHLRVRTIEAEGLREAVDALMKELAAEREAGAAAVSREQALARTAADTAANTRAALERQLALQQEAAKEADQRLAHLQSQLDAAASEGRTLEDKLAQTTAQRDKLHALALQLRANAVTMEQAAAGVERRLGLLEAAASSAPPPADAQQQGSAAGGSLNAAVAALADAAEALCDRMQQALQQAPASAAPAGVRRDLADVTATLTHVHTFVTSLFTSFQQQQRHRAAAAAAGRDPSAEGAAGGSGDAAAAATLRASTLALERECEELRAALAAAKSEGGAARRAKQEALAQEGAAAARGDALQRLAAREGARAAVLQTQLQAAQAEAERLKREVTAGTSRVADLQAALEVALRREEAAEAQARAAAARAEGAEGVAREERATAQRYAAQATEATAAAHAATAAAARSNSGEAAATAAARAAAAEAAAAEARVAAEAADQRAARAEAEAEAARSAAGAAESAARAADQARLEMVSLLAEARRHDEETADLLRHAEVDKAALAARIEALQGEVREERARADRASADALTCRLAVAQRAQDAARCLDDLVGGKLLTARTGAGAGSGSAGAVAGEGGEAAAAAVTAAVEALAAAMALPGVAPAAAAADDVTALKAVA